MAKRIRLCDDAIIHELFDGDSSDEDDFIQDDSDDGEEDIVEEEIHETDTEEAAEDSNTPNAEISDNDDDDNDDCPLANVYLVRVKDKSVMKWRKDPPIQRNVRTRAENIVLRLPGPRGEARETVSEIDCFNLFMNDTLVRLIVSSTNIYINYVKENFVRERDARNTDVEEIGAFIGILLHSGTLGSNRKKTKYIWDNCKGSGVESCYLSMSEKRFHFLMRCVRFDDYRDRRQRKEIDKLAPIREFFELIVQIFKTLFTPSEFCTVDEQLVAFRGRCPFRMYMPKKLARYGIKIYALVCARTMYTVNLEIYAGSQPNGPYDISNASEDVTVRIVEPISNTNRNVTIDNWFTSISLADKLLEEKRLTVVGTIKSARIGVPHELRPNKQRQPNSSLFAFHKNKTLVSYCPKPKKAVLLLSTMHSDNTIDEETGPKQKPEIVTFYNKTKVGVDVVDQMCEKYNVARNTRRWPMVIFFDLLNISVINALCVYKFNNPSEKALPRSEFIQKVAWNLIKPQIERRCQVPCLPVNLKRRGKELLGIIPDEPQHLRENTIGRCHLCPRSKDRKPRKNCDKCAHKVCVEHSFTVCRDCMNM